MITIDKIATLTPVLYDKNSTNKQLIEYGRYLVVKKDGKKFIEIFNTTGWAYNNNSIIAYYLPKLN